MRTNSLFDAILMGLVILVFSLSIGCTSNVDVAVEDKSDIPPQELLCQVSLLASLSHPDLRRDTIDSVSSAVFHADQASMWRVFPSHSGGHCITMMVDQDNGYFEIHLVDTVNGSAFEMCNAFGGKHKLLPVDCVWSPTDTEVEVLFEFSDAGAVSWIEFAIPDQSEQVYPPELQRLIAISNQASLPEQWYKRDRNDLTRPVWGVDGRRYRSARLASQAGVRVQGNTDMSTWESAIAFSVYMGENVGHTHRVVVDNTSQIAYEFDGTDIVSEKSNVRSFHCDSRIVLVSYRENGLYVSCPVRDPKNIRVPALPTVNFGLADDYVVWRYSDFFLANIVDGDSLTIMKVYPRKFDGLSGH